MLEKNGYFLIAFLGDFVNLLVQTKKEKNYAILEWVPILSVLQNFEGIISKGHGLIDLDLTSLNHCCSIFLGNVEVMSSILIILSF